MEPDNYWTCDGCERLVHMDLGWGVSTCEKSSRSMCAACIRKVKVWHGANPRKGDRSIYGRRS